MNDLKTDQLIKRLSHRAPLLTHPEALTDSIMNALPEKDSERRSWLKLIRVISSSAAAFLIGVFLYQQSAMYNPGDGQDFDYLFTNRTKEVKGRQHFDCVMYTSSVDFHSSPNDYISVYESYIRYLKKNQHDNLRSRLSKQFN